jgi:hypothetical protein
MSCVLIRAGVQAVRSPFTSSLYSPAVRLVVLLALAALLAACGGSPASTPATTAATTTTPTPAPVEFTGARAKTTAAGSAQFRLTITAVVGGSTITAEENGTVSFTERRAHLYKQIPGSPVPQELVLIGPYTYTNANIQAALADPTVKPWTKLDTRRLTAAQRAKQPDEFAHVLAPAYLADGVAAPRRIGSAQDGTTRFAGVVDPARLARRLPSGQRAALLQAVRNDYSTKPFAASLWLDDAGRVRRVRVSYTTPQGSRITVDTRYSTFGTKIDVALPAPGDIADISPKSS